MLQHIAFEVTENDIQEFYIGILGGKITKQFTLNENDSKKIFNIPNQIDVYELLLHNLKFELFIHEVLEQDSLQHICIELDNASEVFLKANEKNYNTHLRKRNDRETYFIKDNNGNMFELKNK